jgi:hypothetical protein
VLRVERTAALIFLPHAEPEHLFTHRFCFIQATFEQDLSHAGSPHAFDQINSLKLDRVLWRDRFVRLGFAKLCVADCLVVTMNNEDFTSGKASSSAIFSAAKFPIK